MLKLFDSIFLAEKVPLASFLEFLKLHVSDKCSLIVQEYTLQHLVMSVSSSKSPDVKIDIEKLNVLYGKPIPRSFLNILCTLRFEFQNTTKCAPNASAKSVHVSDNNGLLLNSAEGVLSTGKQVVLSSSSSSSSSSCCYCSVDRTSTCTFLRKYLLSSCIKQSTVGRILKLSQVFVFNDPKQDDKDEAGCSSVLLSSEERVRHIEAILCEAEVIISNLKKQFDLFDGDAFTPNIVVVNSSDRSLSNCVHICMMFIEDIQDKLKVVDMALHFNSSNSSSRTTSTNTEDDRKASIIPLLSSLIFLIVYDVFLG